MPAKNIVKSYGADQYYHIYSRGVNKQAIFEDEQDYLTFLSLFKRYLSRSPQKQPGHGFYPHYDKKLQLLAHCLMSNHVHLLVYQSNERAIAEFMKSLLTSYSMYFNRKYRRVGPVFQSRYKASLVSQQDYLEHISRYIHLNPRDWESYPYSSLEYYIDKAKAEWIKPKKIIEMFPNKEQYLEFVRDYEGYKEMLDEIHWDLADQP